MQEEIIKLIESDLNIYNSIDEINNAYNILKNRINEKFWVTIKIKSEKIINPIFITSDGKEIHYRIAEDGGFYFGFYFKNIYSKPEEFENYKTILNDKDKSRFPKYNSNKHHIAWIHSIHINAGKKFADLSKDFIFGLNDENEMNAFTDKIIIELESYINEIKNEFEYGSFSNSKSL